ncbi:type VI secretion system tip protein TssI/VgrG [Sorangium sp. So ce1014]|uniref:type VI secretion system Vgr family protein n=1 Tax=Sorangium sp. So ce1014 TaxID=3133326 RepID=UPI003F63D35C
MSDLITFSSSILQGPARVVGFRGVEAISRPYRVEIFLSIPSEGEDDTDFAEMVGAKARLSIDRPEDINPPYVFTGVLAGVDLVHEFGGRALLRAVLVPRLWGLTLSKHSRIFTKKSVPDVIKLVLEENGLTGGDVELNLGSYETEEHICQYRESDFDFISRWMEREGIYYYFEHTDDGEKLILCDDRSYPAEPLGAPVRYHPQTGEDRSASASFRTFSCQHGALPSRVKLKDYDYVRPQFPLAGAAPVSPYGTGEISLHGERFFSADAGKRLAQLRAEEYLAREAVYQATGARLHLRSGTTFELEDHPRARFNAKYLAVELRHHGNQSAGHSDFAELAGLLHEEVYFVEVSAIPAATQFRAESRTAWPRIYGYENGSVDGSASSEYAQIDEHGRYLVKLKFDEASPRDGSGSTFVRMMQPHGGGVEGFHFPLRRGTEVVLSFLGGDPDRPVIAGVVPNVLTPSPVTSGNHTKNVIQTGGRNRLELEDQAGAQRITLSTPYSNTYMRMGSPNKGHELIGKTDGNILLDSGVNMDFQVGASWTSTAEDDITTTATSGDITTTASAGNITTTATAGTLTETAKGDVTITSESGNVHIKSLAADVNIFSQSDLNIETKGNRNEKTTGNDTKEREGNYVLITKGSASSEVHGFSSSMTIGAGRDIKLGAFLSVAAAASTDLKLSRAVSVTVGQAFDLKAGSFTSVNVSKSLDIKLASTTELKATSAQEFTVGSKQSFSLSRNMEVTAGQKVSFNLTNSVEFKLGASVSVKNGPELTIQGPKFTTKTVELKNGSFTLQSVAAEIRKHGIFVVS